MATIYDVAQRAGVSTYTVSAVLNQSAKVSTELTDRVLKAADELDYTINRIASSLQTRKTMTVGMLIPDLGNPWFAKVVRGVEDVCRQNGYSLFLGNTNNCAEEQARYLTVFRSRQVDGVLLFMAPESEEEIENSLLKRRMPTVFVGRRPRDLDADMVVADNRLGARLAVDHLISQGHQRIAILTGQISLFAAKDRVAGWRSSLKRAGLSAPAEYVKSGDWSADCAKRQMLELLDLSVPPTAVFASNLPIMTGALAGLKERRVRVPKSMEVMCSDDSEWLDVFEPRISTVEQPSYEMGTAAADLLLKRIGRRGKSPATQIVLKPVLKLRP